MSEYDPVSRQEDLRQLLHEECKTTDLDTLQETIADAYAAAVALKNAPDYLRKEIVAYLLSNDPKKDAIYSALVSYVQSLWGLFTEQERATMLAEFSRHIRERHYCAAHQGMVEIVEGEYLGFVEG